MCIQGKGGSPLALQARCHCTGGTGLWCVQRDLVKRDRRIELQAKGAHNSTLELWARHWDQVLVQSRRLWYAQPLVALDTIATVPPQTLAGWFEDHGVIAMKSWLWL